MKKLMMPGFGVAAAAVAAAAATAVIGTGGANVLQGDEVAKTPKPKRKVKRRRQVAKANRLLNPYSRSKYIPGGENINCGERGISPKSYERVLAATKRRKSAKNLKKEN